MRRSVVWLAAVLLASLPAVAQSEAVLRDAIEGKTVVVKVDMPANKAGIDVYPEASPPMNYVDYGNRLKRYGISLQSNESVVVTKIRVKEKNIEFQLGGGGFGTAGDDTSTSVYVPYAEKTQREKDLERDIKNEPDSSRERRLQQELDELRSRRNRENARLQAAAAVAEATKAESVRQRALTAGSRFNLIFPKGVPADALTPEYLMQALKAWVDFSPQPALPALAEKRTDAVLRKGMSEDELVGMLGEPTKREPGTFRDLRYEALTFKKDGSTLEAIMVEGVLVRFRQWSD